MFDDVDAVIGEARAMDDIPKNHEEFKMMKCDHL